MIALLLVAALLAPKSTPVALPGGSGGIGFDDMGWSPALGRVVVPAGRSGNVDLIDPATGAIETIGGFAASKGFAGGHGSGVTSADAGFGLLFATDRDARTLDVVDPKTKKIVSRAPLAAGPDYVRVVALSHEVWVTEPRAEAIEVFSLDSAGHPSHAASISVKGGPESLVIDATRGRAYTHRWKDDTVAIDLRSRAVVSTRASGCEGPRGIALDEAKGWLFVGCEEGGAARLDLAHPDAAPVRAKAPEGVDIIAWDATHARLYAPGADAAEMSVLSVSSSGALTEIARVKTAADAHCVAADPQTGAAYVCDPKAGRLLKFSF